MDRKRTVKRISKIIDLFNHDSARLIGKSSIRIRYDYDGINNHEEFTVLNNDLPAESAEKIIIWLKENVKSEDLIYGTDTNNLDVEDYSFQKKAA